MRMSGYSGRVRSMSWSADGAFLATSGSEQVILWMFDGKDGPMGRQPKLLAPEEARVSVVACHPKQPVVAAGYAHGLLLLVRMDDGALIQVRAADGVPVTALGWGASGQMLGYGTESGDAGILTL
jgi:WD40 repeat protein